ncbi:MAG: restriction endonuclease, partial [Tenericutes bacterium HGW-Tenericutes-5]
MKKFVNDNELLSYIKQFNGKPFKEFDINKRLDNSRNKGSLGQIVEEGIFGYEINSDSRPDFEELGIELKVTPIKKNKDGTFSSKERLVLNIINFNEEYKHNFETSSFIKKSKKMLIIFYLYEDSISPKDFKIIDSIIYEFGGDDLSIIQDDWNNIIEKIKNGEAHKISGSDSFYLEACTKGATAASSLVKQPFSNKLAKRRAFALKGSFMTSVYRKIVLREDYDNSSLKVI